MTSLRQTLQATWQQQGRSKPLVVEIYLMIGNGGELLSAAVQKTSADPNFDSSALEAVKKSAPFAKSPQSDYLKIVVTFDGRVNTPYVVAPASSPSERAPTLSNPLQGEVMQIDEGVQKSVQPDPDIYHGSEIGSNAKPTGFSTRLNQPQLDGPRQNLSGYAGMHFYQGQLNQQRPPQEFQQHAEQFGTQNPTDQHGEEAMGVLGGPFKAFLFDSSVGIITSILPGSDLLRFGIHAGDRYLGINGHRFNSFTFARECHGVPGSTIDLDVLHDGEVVHIVVRRMDGRVANQQYVGPDNNYRWAAEHTRQW